MSSICSNGTSMLSFRMRLRMLGECFRGSFAILKNRRKTTKAPTALDINIKFNIFVVGGKGFEPLAPWFEATCSIQLS